MFDYLTKFKDLPKEVREKVSTPLVMTAINELEKKYKVNLATLVMKVSVKEIAVDKLANIFVTDFGLDISMSNALTTELKEKVFFAIREYLNFNIVPLKSATNSTDIVKIVKALGVSNLVKSKDESEVEELAKELKSLPPQNRVIKLRPDLSPVSTILKSKDEIEVSELARELKESTSSSNVATINNFSLEKQPVIIAPQVNIPKGAGFFFSPEDEEEIRQLSQKAVDDNLVSSSGNIENKVNQIIEMVKISFSSDLLVVRFRQILTTYLKGIRGRIETRLTLAKNFQDGGLALDEQAITRILSLTDGFKITDSLSNVKSPVKFLVPEDEMVKKKLAELKDVGARDFEYDLSREINKREELKNKQASVVVDIEKKSLASEEVKIVKEKEVLPAETAAPTDWERVVIRRPLEAGNKIRIEDVKMIPKTMGPIEELKFLDPISFRRLDKDPNKACLKVIEKINLLEQEQYSKRLEGIKAWRLNSVNQLYLNIGEMAIGENKPVDIVIEEKRTAGEEYLNSEEFEAIMNLNKQLRF